MQARCEYSKLSVPNDRLYVPVAVAYAAEISKKLGFEDIQRMEIGLAVDEVINTVMEYAFEPGDRQTFEISCERIPVGLQLVIKEKGMPFDPSRIPAFQPKTQDGRKTGRKAEIPLLRDLVDEFSVHNLGPDGQEIHLVKYLRNKSIQEYFQACELEQFQRPPKTARPRSKSCRVRRPPAETLGGC